MPELKRYRFNAITGGFELIQNEAITEQQQLQIIEYFNKNPACNGFYKYVYKQLEGTDSEGFTATADLIGYINANHQNSQPIEPGNEKSETAS